MTRKDFKLIASVLWGEKPIEPLDEVDDAYMFKWKCIVTEFAERLAKTNNAFNREKFLKACGIE